MATADQRRRLGELLRRIADGRTSVADAQLETGEWAGFPWGDRDILRAYEGLLHFEMDADIRRRDAAYAAAEIAGLRRLADLLDGTDK